MKKLLTITTSGIALSASWGAVGAASEPAPESNEAAIPQAAHRIFDWALDGHQGIWVQSVDKRWYYAAFISPCIGAVPDNITFKLNNANGSLDRFGQVIVHRLRRSFEVCAFKSFGVSAGPPAGVLHAVPHPGKRGPNGAGAH